MTGRPSFAARNCTVSFKKERSRRVWKAAGKRSRRPSLATSTVVALKLLIGKELLSRNGFGVTAVLRLGGDVSEDVQSCLREPGEFRYPIKPASFPHFVCSDSVRVTRSDT